MVEGRAARGTQSHSRASLAMSARAALLRACCLLALVAGSRQFSIKEFTVPVAVEAGQLAELRCLYDLGENEKVDQLDVKWWWLPHPKALEGRKQLYQNIGGTSSGLIHNKDRENASNIEIRENNTLVLSSVTPADSGTYECDLFITSDNITEIREQASLIVYSIGSGPKVNYSVTEDQLLIECEAEDVTPIPNLIVNVNGNVINTTELVEDADEDGFFNISAIAILSLQDLEESVIRCELVYADSNVPGQPYAAVTTYIPTGGAAPSTTDIPVAAPEPPATPDSLQNISGDGYQLHSSWVLLSIAALLTRLHLTL